MIRTAAIWILLLTIGFLSASELRAQQIERTTRKIKGWTLHVDKRLTKEHPQLTRRAIELLEDQLTEIVRVVPKEACEKLRQIPLYFSPEYPGSGPRAEFHPNETWLRDNGRDPAMAQAVEFSNIQIFEQEMTRMPNFALHELAHGYHFKFVEGGNENADVKEAFQRAKASGKYDEVARRNGKGQKETKEKAYGMTNEMEYFAELTEAYFSRNDFFPFDRKELRAFDPAGFEMIQRVWQVPK